MLSLAQFKAKLTADRLTNFPFIPAIEFLWRFELSAEAAELWPYLTDTSRLNREMGFGAREHVEQNGKLLITTKMLGREQKWLEEPWTWIENRVITCTREYFHGLARRMFSVFLIEEKEVAERTVIYVYFAWVPSNLLWKTILKLSAPMLQKKFAAAFAKIDQALLANRGHEGKVLRKAAAPTSDEIKTRLLEIEQKLKAQKLDPNIIAKLLEHASAGDEFDVEPLRVLPLARAWKVDQTDLLKTCLHSTRAGLLKISWDVICPHCRGSRFSAENLGSIPASANCEVCDVDFTTADQNSIEVLFHVHPSIRKIENFQFCAAEPAKKAHIRVQQLAPAKSSLAISLSLKPGHYRVRAVGQKWQTELDVGPEHTSTHAQSGGATAKVHAPFQLKFENEETASTLLVVEELKWQNDALKPGDVIAMPEFRDIFAQEHLSSNVKIFLGTQTILFTDIVGSTNFYSKVGDAKAFEEVRGHFQELFAVVQFHRGVVVKTIGDAVMAAFTNTEAALAAAVEMQNRFHSSREDTSIRLRISIHTGPVIAVDLNTGLDYFGNTVNFAAKIQNCAGAGEVALSEAVHLIFSKNPSIYPVLKRQNSRDGAVKTDVFVLQIQAPKVAAA